MTTPIENPVAYLDWSVNVKCPKCGDGFDIKEGDRDCDGLIARAIFGNAWGQLKGHEVTCDCGHEFKLSAVEY